MAAAILPKPVSRRPARQAPRPRARAGHAAAGGRPALLKSPLTKSALTRRRILDAAARLFCERGYADIRMSDIAAAAGTQSGAMYYYFESKDALVEAFLRSGLQPATEYLRAAVNALPAGATWRERIEAAMRTHLTRSLERDAYTLGFMKIFDQVPPAVRERFAGYPKGFAQVWRELIQGAVDAGELRSDLDPAVMRNTLLGSVVWSLEWYQPGKLTPEEIARQMAAMFFDGMSRREDGASPKRRAKHGSARDALLAEIADCSEATVQALALAVAELKAHRKPAARRAVR